VLFVPAWNRCHNYHYDCRLKLVVLSDRHAAPPTSVVHT
jgi:hypothetical protein